MNLDDSSINNPELTVKRKRYKHKNIINITIKIFKTTNTFVLFTRWAHMQPHQLPQS